MAHGTATATRQDGQSNPPNAVTFPAFAPKPEFKKKKKSTLLNNLFMWLNKGRCQPAINRF